jgi:hypothetical protein
MKTEQTIIVKCPCPKCISGAHYDPELVEHYRANGRVYKSRERNIRRAWRLRGELREAEMYYHHSQKRLQEVTRQRDQLLTKLQEAVLRPHGN